MRFSAVAALCAAPLALAGVLEAEVIPRRSLSRRDGHAKVAEPVKVVKEVHGANTHATATTIVIIWVNQGGGAATQTHNPTQVAPQQTHTVGLNT